MVADIRLVSSVADEPNSGWNGEVPIFDMAGFTVRHITCVVLSVLRVYMKYTQVRMKKTHSQHIYSATYTFQCQRTGC